MGLFRRPSSEPLWRDEFSVFTADERYVNRRQLTKFLTLTSFAMLAGNLWILVRSWFQGAPEFPATAVARVDEVPRGGVRLFGYPGPGDRCILIRAADGSFAAFSQKCTHLACAVIYAVERDRLECPCHEGFFSARDGRVLAGPPQRPLPRVVLERRGNQLVAVAVQLEEASS